jgi:hypothetical protein
MKKFLVLLVVLVVGFVVGAHAVKCPVLKNVCPFAKPAVCDKNVCVVGKCVCGDQCCCCEGCCKK